MQSLRSLAAPVSTLRELRAARARERAERLGREAIAAEIRVAELPRELAFPEVAAPEVSIVIPVHGKLDYTRRCLGALSRHEPRHAFEVIVVDDASKDDTRAALSRIPGLALVALDENRGFIGACNAGAARARGRTLLFLNNDTVPLRGFSDALVDTLGAWPGAGLVGSMMIFPDGRVQEAGGIVFADGTPFHYARLACPDEPRLRYTREADYVSGASILLEKSFFDALGGFDTHYAPAYFEDTDLAMRVRRAGRRVIVEPASRVVHFEGVTSGTDVRHGPKRHQVENQVKFQARFRDDLRAHAPVGTHPDRAKDRGARGRLLVIDEVTPTPDRDSGSQRMATLLGLLRELGWAVTFAASHTLARRDPYTSRLERAGVEVLAAPWTTSIEAHLRAEGSRYDGVVLSHVQVASPLVPLVRRYARGAKLVFDTVDLHYLREEREAALSADPSIAERAARTKAEELAVMREADETWVVSEVESALLAREAPGARVRIVSNAHAKLDVEVSLRGREEIGFLGNFAHPPNVDAARLLALEVMPLVRRELPGARAVIVGGAAPAEVAALASEHTRVAGWVEDLGPELARWRVSVAPLRFGAGVKGKINTAMNHGVPVVATTLAAEGMGLVDGVDACLADDAAGLAAAVVRVMRDDELFARLSAAGRASVAARFSIDRARAALAEAFP